MEIGTNRERNRAWLAPKQGDTIHVAEHGPYDNQAGVGPNPLATKRRGPLGRAWEALKNF